MGLVDGGYVCAGCGTTLGRPPMQEPLATIIGEGGKPNVRVFRIGRREIHRCEIDDRSAPDQENH